MTNTKNKFFPIKSEPACKLKWSWTTLFLNSGKSATCHRTCFHELTPENFKDFHNNPSALADRQMMLSGHWPESNCGYCKNIEQSGGVSDRIRQLSIPGLYPDELDTDPEAIVVTPKLLEVYFSNTCNLGCLYCDPSLSSVINQENKTHGDFNQRGVTLLSKSNQFKDLSPHFWEWFRSGFAGLERLQILGGEPFYQKELGKLIDYIDEFPNSNCEVNIVSNLMIPHEKFIEQIHRFKQLVAARKIKRLDITCSIDCWGPEQEYVRWGLDLELWQKNFEFLIENKWIYLTVNQTISALTIKTMPEFITNLNHWRTKRKIGHWFSGVTPGPSYLKAEIFGNKEFVSEAENVLQLMPRTNDEESLAHEYMQSIFNSVLNAEMNLEEIGKLITFLDEKDRRRNTNWEQLFPWLTKYRELCGITK